MAGRKLKQIDKKNTKKSKKIKTSEPIPSTSSKFHEFESNLNNEKSKRKLEKNEQDGSDMKKQKTGLSSMNNYKLMDINVLNPFQSNWTIKARVDVKRPIYCWKNEKCTGKLFNMDISDKSARIRVIAFKNMVDKFYDRFEIGEVYLFANLDIKNANTKFSTIKNNFELTLTNDTIIQRCEEDTTDIPNIEYEYKTIADIKLLSEKSIFNTMGICHEIKGVEEIAAKKRVKFIKKEM